jgi:hypothetical protein
MAEALKVMEKPPYSKHPPSNPLFSSLSVMFSTRSTLSWVVFATAWTATPGGSNLPVESSDLFMAPTSPNSCYFRSFRQQECVRLSQDDGTRFPDVCHWPPAVMR